MPFYRSMERGHRHSESSNRWPIRRLIAAAHLVLMAAACTPPIRQFDLKDRALTCEQANAQAFRTLQSMDFTITEFSPATVGHPGKIRGTREERGTQNVTVVITCDGNTASIDAHEDGRILNQLEIKRGFYLTFVSMAPPPAASAAVATNEAVRAPEQPKGQGLQVLLAPVKGLEAKLDFGLDLAAAGVLPVRVTMNNVTPRTYRFDPADIVLVQTDGTRVRPLAIETAAQRVAASEQSTAAANHAAAPDRDDVMHRLQERALTGHSLAAHHTVTGYVFFPLAQYVKGRAALEDQASEETEGFVVEF